MTHWHVAGIAFAVTYAADALRGPGGKINLPILGSMPTLFSFPQQGLLTSIIGGGLGGVFGAIGGGTPPSTPAQ